MIADAGLPLVRWPDVPACFGWLSLDRRGNWRLRGERVSHGGLVAWLARNYAGDDAGRWFCQNGPQRVFVTLEYTPWVFRLQPDGRLLSHCNSPAGVISDVLADESGNVLFATALGVGLLDDRDLVEFLAGCDGDPTAGTGSWQGRVIGRIRRHEVAARFAFVANPEP